MITSGATIQTEPVPLADLSAPSDVFAALLSQRRSIRRLQGGDLPAAVIQRLQQAVLRTPAAFSVTPWHVVLVHGRRQELWQEVEAGFRERLECDRLDRYLSRLDGFRNGSAAVLLFEDRAALPALRDCWSLSDEVAHDFVQQGLGMVQLAIWLTLTADDLVTSLQHWDWLLQERLAAFAGLATDRFHLACVMPIGYANETPRPLPDLELDQCFAIDPGIPTVARSNGAHP